MSSIRYLLRSRTRSLFRSNVWLVLIGIVTFALGTRWYLKRPRIALHGYATEIVGQAGGYKVLKNVVYHDHTFFSLNTSQPDEATIMTGTRAAVINASRFMVHDYYPGTTLFLNEGATLEWNGLWHFYHFVVENILGGLAALGAVYDRPVMPDRLIVPWLDNWHDGLSLNDNVVAALFGPAVITADEWRKLENNHIFFDELVLVDRWAAHNTDSEVGRWTSMPIEVFQNLLDLGRSHFWDVARNRIYRHFKTAPSNRQRIAYINKQHTDIHLPHWKHESFIASMHRLAAEYDDVEFDDLILSELTPEEQFRRISLATIIVGIHGDGLTHLVWMPPRSAVIELFLPLTFSRDYQVAAEVLGHDYTVIRGRELYPKREWQPMAGGHNQSMLVSGAEVDVDVQLLVDTVRRALEARV